MAKSRQNGTLTVAEQQLPATTAEQLPAASAADFGGGFAIEGREQSSTTLSRLILYQGTSEEESLYGQRKRGVFLDALEIRELGESVRIMPVFAVSTFALWKKGERRPSQSWKHRKDVPKGMLDWTDDPTDPSKRLPPEVTESVHIICCVVGESWPYRLVVKRTSMEALEKTINPLEDRRAKTGKCPGLYELGSKEDKNGAGQIYRRLTARPVGDPPPETVALALSVFRAKSIVEAAATTAAESDHASESGYDPNAD